MFARKSKPFSKSGQKSARKSENNASPPSVDSEAICYTVFKYLFHGQLEQLTSGVIYSNLESNQNGRLNYSHTQVIIKVSDIKGRIRIFPLNLILLDFANALKSLCNLRGIIGLLQSVIFTHGTYSTCVCGLIVYVVM